MSRTYSDIDTGRNLLTSHTICCVENSSHSTCSIGSQTSRDTARPCIGPMGRGWMVHTSITKPLTHRPIPFRVLYSLNMSCVPTDSIRIASAPEPRCLCYPKRDRTQHAIPRNTRGLKLVAATAARHRSFLQHATS